MVPNLSRLLLALYYDTISLKGIKVNKEIWKSIKGFEGYYEISDQGNVKSLICRYKNTKKVFIMKQETSTNRLAKIMF